MTGMVVNVVKLVINKVDLTQMFSFVGNLEGYKENNQKKTIKINK